jgi:tRNA dimethylallyltransferase
MISTKTEREVKQFLQLKINTLLPANFIIGIKEFKDYFAKIITKEKLIELIIIRTKQYAKRQFTWQRGQMSDWNQFFDQDYQKLFKKVSNLLSKT